MAACTERFVNRRNLTDGLCVPSALPDMAQKSYLCTSIPNYERTIKARSWRSCRKPSTAKSTRMKVQSDKLLCEGLEYTKISSDDHVVLFVFCRSL